MYRRALRTFYPPSGRSQTASLAISSLTSSTGSFLWSSRSVVHVTTSATFDREVLQSQQAICLVYQIPSSTGCAAFIKSAEKLVDDINAKTSAVVVSDDGTVEASAESVMEEVVIDLDEEPLSASEMHTARRAATSSDESAAGTGSASGGGGKKSLAWLKLCSINADENRNLASAFSVERAKLPVTFFIMQGTIVDKFSGLVSESRLEGILWKFLEHYQKETNVDLMTKRDRENEASAGSSSPIPAAATADLLHGASTQFLQAQLMRSLVGSEMIQLPEDAPQIDGLKKTLQQAKQKAYEEVQSLYRQLGMDMRRLSDSEMHAHYYQSSQFVAMGVISALEALFLARTHATLGDISQENVAWARRALQKDFETVLGNPTMRQVLALVDVNLVRGELRVAAVTCGQDLNQVGSTLAAFEAEASAGDAQMVEMKDMVVFLEGQREHLVRLLYVIDEYIDNRAPSPSFPSDIVEELFAGLKESRRQLRKLKAEEFREGTAASPPAQNTLPVLMNNQLKKQQILHERSEHTKTCVMCLLQIYATDPKSQAARSKLSSLLY